MIRGKRFLLSTFEGSLKCVAKTWVMKLEAFFLLHLVVEREAVEIATLHLEGEENVWWFSHLSHARVSTLSELSQRLIEAFGKERSEEERPSPPLEEAYTTLSQPWRSSLHVQ